MFNRVDNDKGFSEPTKRTITNSIDWQEQKKGFVFSEGLSFSSGAQWTHPEESSRNTESMKNARRRKRNGDREILNKFLHPFQIAAPQLDLRAWVDNYHSINLFS